MPSNTTTTTKASSSSDDIKSILLKHGLMPDYQSIQLSEELYENYIIRLQRQHSGVTDTSSSSTQQRQRQQLQQLDEETIQQIIILHSYFSKFCYPSPSIENIVNVVLLEKERIDSLQDKDCRSNNKEGATYSNNNLPKETLIHTSSNSSSYIIKLLRRLSSSSSHQQPKQQSALLKLPLVFQLAFFRILIRLLCGEDDDEYDMECLFDWTTKSSSSSSLTEEEKENGGDIEKKDSEKQSDKEVDATNMMLNAKCRLNNEMMDESKNRGRGNELSSSDDDSYERIGSSSMRGRATSVSSSIIYERKSNKNRDRAVSSSSQQQPQHPPKAVNNIRSSSNRNNIDTTTGKAYTAWSFAKWKKKKCAPLYSVVRFCSNVKWYEKESDDGAKKEFVDNNVQLKSNEDGVTDGDSDDEEEEHGIASHPYGREDTVGVLIRIYHAILDKCLKQQQQQQNNNDATPSYYLLLGPVAHLIGLICATKVSVKNLRLLLVLVEGSDTTLQQQQQSRSKKRSQQLMTLSRLHILRSIRYAAEYSNQINGSGMLLMDKPGPRTFFSFGKSGGKLTSGNRGLSASFQMSNTINWPFKHDFGMACWFRAESFSAFHDNRTSSKVDDDDDDDAVNVVLFSARAQNGAQIEVSFKSHSVESGGSDGGSSSTAATLIVTVTDATINDSSARPKQRKVRLVGCVLSPLVWYHVAVRLSRPRLSRFSLAPFTISKDEVSIFLNGKLMLREHMKMPQFPESGGAGSGSLAGSIGNTFGSFSSSNNEPTKIPFEISFLSNFDGQAGSLYVFKDRVSEETIDALYRETISSSSSSMSLDQSNNYSSHFGSFVDRWDTNHGKLNSLTKAVSVASMHSELRDVVLPNYSMFIGEYPSSRIILFDLVGEDDIDSKDIPMGLSRGAFGSKLLVVWDPCRICDGTLIDPHSGANVTLEDRASSWSFESLRDTIESLGGISRLLPLFGILQEQLALSDNGENEEGRRSVSRGITNEYPSMIIPSLVFLISSFIREHEANSCELYRCGGINVIEKLLNDNKRQDLEEGTTYRLGMSPTIAEYNASALLDLWQASRLNFALETTIFSRLVFNVPLLLGGLSKAKGISFHCLYLPILSEITMMNGDKVRDCIETGELFDLVNEYSSSGDATVQDDLDYDDDDIFAEAGSPESTLSAAEQSFVVDTLFGMITIMLSKKCPSSDLYPLLTFITYNLDLEWEATSADINRSNGLNECRYQTTVKAVSIFFFLLQKPNVPSLNESLTDIFENGNGVASWILCCLVNSFDDTIRGLGIKCLAAYLRIATITSAIKDTTSSGTDSGIPLRSVPSTQKLQKTMKLGFEAISHQANNMLSSVRNGKINIKIIYKLLWHLLKCHRERLGRNSYAALMYLIIIEDGSTISSSVPLSDIIIPNHEMLGGFRLCSDELDTQSSKVDPRQSIRNKYGVSTVMRLIRFLSNDQKERWLFDILAFMLASSQSVTIILSCDDWQPVLFQLVAEVLEEIYGEDSDDGKSNRGNDETGLVRSESGQTMVNTETLSKPSVRTRYDLSLKLYSTLLGHCVRQGDDIAFDAVEMAASLQRVDANGSEIYSILLSHLFADLIEKGTVASIEKTYSNSEAKNTGRNRALKQSAKLITQSILSNGASGIDMKTAVKQWRCLRHLTALTVAVVTESGFGVVQLFDYRNQDASAVDGITGGIYGIRLDNLVSGVNSFEALAGAKLHANKRRDRYRYVSVVLASQMLTILDAFIFPDNLDASQAVSQQHGLSLVRNVDPRFTSQGTMLASLVRLSLILLAYLEPSSVRFLQACSRLRCFLHWILEILRESVALGGYSEAYHELTAPLDRMVLAIVLQCHRALARCSMVLKELESSPWQKYFSDIESRDKSIRRLFRSILELKEIVLAVYRGRNEVLWVSLSPMGYEALANGLKISKASSPKANEEASKEASLRTFLENDWVSGFHDVDVEGDVTIPEQIGSNGQTNQGQESSDKGKQAIQLLALESTAIIKEYSNLLNTPFTLYCETQRKWAETDAVRDREYEGDVLVKKLSGKYRTDIVDLNKSMTSRSLLALERLAWIVLITNDPWTQLRHWKFNSQTDLLYRRIVFHPNCNFDDHASASYELTLGKERETYQLEVEARKRREEEARNEREMSEALRAAIVPYAERTEDDIEDDDEDDMDDIDQEGFLGWGDTQSGKDESFKHSTSNGDGDGGEDGTGERAQSENEKSLDRKSLVDIDIDIDIDDSWDQIEAADLDESNDLDPFAWARKFMWTEGERLVHSFESIVIVSIESTRAGTLLLTTHSIYFHQIGETLNVITKEAMEAGDDKKEDKKWRLNRLTDIHGRRYMLKAQAVELFFADMEGVFITFNGTKDRDMFHAKLRSNCKVPLLRSFKSLNPRTVFKKSKLTELWRKRKISNFQYIMALNLMAGRTFNDITQYPVFPWILADYTSDTLDLSDESVYRDLSKPVGALNPDRLEMLLDRYEDLDGFPEEEKFIYGSHYSSPGVVLHYLIRQEPYTSMHIALQSDRFDCPDRLFFDMGGCWRSCNTSTSDVKELIPEFFLCPDIFTNTNDFPLGQTQSKISVSSVKLPPWAKGSPHEFIRLHRLALESEYVSNNLHHWVDLIFGYKQRGPAALDAHNVFHYLSYEGSVDIDKITDEVEQKAVEGHISNFGQTPSQLITKDPHPPRSFSADEAIPLFQDLSLEHMRCDTPKKQFGGPNRTSASGAIISLHPLGEFVFVIHSDLTVCTYKLHHSRGSAPFHFKIDRARVLEGKDASFSKHVRLGEATEANELELSGAIDDGICFQRNVSFAISLGVSPKSVGAVNAASDPSHLLMSCGYFDNNIKTHSLDSLQLQNSVDGGHRGHITCLEVDDEGEVMVTGGVDATCHIWIIDHDYLALAITDGFVKSSPGREVLEDSNCHHAHTLFGHVTAVNSVAICTKLDVAISGAEGGSICIHNIRSGKFLRSLHIDATTKKVQESCGSNGAIPVKKLAIHVDGYFVAHLADGSLYVISINGEQVCKTHIGEHLNAMIICSQSNTVVTGGSMGCAKVWKLNDLSLQCTVDVKKHGSITSLAFTHESEFLCIGSSNGLLSIVSRLAE